MASGKTHRTIGLVSAGALAILATHHGALYEGLCLGAGCTFGATLMNPDQDVDGGYIGNAAARRLGLETPYRVFFRPYQLAYKHRSGWSHFPVLSTIWRVIYLFLPLLVVIFKDQNTSRIRLLSCTIAPQMMALVSWAGFIIFLHYGLIYWVIWGLIGLTINDILHWFVDLF